MKVSLTLLKFFIFFINNTIGECDIPIIDDFLNNSTHIAIMSEFKLNENQNLFDLNGYRFHYYFIVCAQDNQLFENQNKQEKIGIYCIDNDWYLKLYEFNVAGYSELKDTLISEVTEVIKTLTQCAG